MAWKPKILSDFEIGQAVLAIELVGRADKPIAEIGYRIATREDIESDLIELIRAANESGRVQPWVRQSGAHFRFGVHGAAWTAEALDFLERADLDERTRYWITGLLFGYRPAAIQRFLDAQHPEPANQLGDHMTRTSLEMVHQN